MDEAQVYWVDERNASRPVVTSRTHNGVPAGRVVMGTHGTYGYGQPVVYRPGSYAAMQQQGVLASLGLTMGQVIDIGLQTLAALQSLPTAPVATSDVSKDVANLILYQSALAGHAKRDEQFRTLGSVVGQLLK